MYAGPVRERELVLLASHSSRVILNSALLCLLPRYPTELGWKLLAVVRDGNYLIAVLSQSRDEITKYRCLFGFPFS